MSPFDVTTHYDWEMHILFLTYAIFMREVPNTKGISQLMSFIPNHEIIATHLFL